MQLLVAGATGNVGVHLIERLLSDPRWRVARVRASCHNRTSGHRSSRGSSKEVSTTAAASSRMRDVTHVVDLATCKEIPETVMDVTVKGLFWLLEAFRQSTTAKQFMLIGGDAAVGRSGRPPGRRRPGASCVRRQCLVAAFVLACAKKKRIISRLASGPRVSV
jgi:UDP-glucose 4-epimerase